MSALVTFDKSQLHSSEPSEQPLCQSQLCSDAGGVTSASRRFENVRRTLPTGGPVVAEVAGAGALRYLPIAARV